MDWKEGQPPLELREGGKEQKSYPPREVSLDELNERYAQAERNLDEFMRIHQDAFREMEEFRKETGREVQGIKDLYVLEKDFAMQLLESGTYGDTYDESDASEPTEDEDSETFYLRKSIRSNEDKQKVINQYRRMESLFAKYEHLINKRDALEIEINNLDPNGVSFCRGYNGDRFVRCRGTFGTMPETINDIDCKRFFERGRDEKEQLTEELPLGWGGDKDEPGGDILTFHCPEHKKIFSDEELSKVYKPYVTRYLFDQPENKMDDIKVSARLREIFPGITDKEIRDCLEDANSYKWVQEAKARQKGAKR